MWYLEALGQTHSCYRLDDLGVPPGEGATPSTPTGPEPVQDEPPNQHSLPEEHFDGPEVKRFVTNKPLTHEARSYLPQTIQPWPKSGTRKMSLLLFAVVGGVVSHIVNSDTEQDLGKPKTPFGGSLHFDPYSLSKVGLKGHKGKPACGGSTSLVWHIPTEALPGPRRGSATQFGSSPLGDLRRFLYCFSLG